MADGWTKVTRLIFDIQDELTVCEVQFDTDDPVLTGGRRRRKTFPASKSCIDILKEDVPGYLLWD
jgi:hypothetical protein